jgi:hypothetical protein
MLLEPRDIGVLIRAEADRIGKMAENNLLRELPDMRKALAKLTMLMEALETAGIKR